MRHLRQLARSLRDTLRGRSAVCLDTCLVLPNAKLVYAYIPKAACTSIKTWLLCHSGECPEIAKQFAQAERTSAKPPDSHETMRDLYSVKRWSATVIKAALSNSAYFKFTFVRHPFSRLVSGYLDKVVKTKITAHELITSGQVASGNPQASLAGWWQKQRFDAERSLTFREFVGALQAADQESLDVHFRAQHRLLKGLKLDFVGKMEHLPNDFAAVQQHLRTAAPLAWKHKSDYKATSPVAAECVADWPAARFRGVPAPPWQSFFDEAVRAASYDLYAVDFERFGYDAECSNRRAA